MPSSSPSQHTQDIYANDKLHREGIVSHICERLKGENGPLTLALDATWGVGKTTILQLLERELKSQQAICVFHNAWECDDAPDPLIPLLSDITAKIKELNPLSGAVTKLADQAKEHGARILTIGLSAYTGLPISAPTPKPFDEYEKRQAARTTFRDHLSRLAILAKENRIEGFAHEREVPFPFIVIVDELDRCRPTYAIALLERVKHLFGVRNVVFVFGVAREALSHSVQGVYGHGFDGNHYLNRFFDETITVADEGHLNLLRGLSFGGTCHAGSKDHASILSLLSLVVWHYRFTARDLVQASSIAKRHTFDLHIHNKPRFVALVVIAILFRLRGIDWDSEVQLAVHALSSASKPSRLQNALHGELFWPGAPHRHSLSLLSLAFLITSISIPIDKVLDPQITELLSHLGTSEWDPQRYVHDIAAIREFFRAFGTIGPREYIFRVAKGLAVEN